MKKHKKPLIVLGVVVALLAIAAVIKPSDRGGSYAPYYSQINETLKEAGIAQPCAVIDLDRVDRNIAAMNRVMKPPIDYRVVVKSLPSMELIKHVLQKTGSKKIMEFNIAHLELITRELPGDVDILLGKPLPAALADRFYGQLPASARVLVSRRIQWLVDTDVRLKEYLEVARKYNLTLRINVEIDAGLHRGGAAGNAELAKMLTIIRDNPKQLIFSGYMGYDGHLPYNPLYLWAKESGMKKELEKIMARYRGFVDYGKKGFPDLFRGELTFNGGGSKTYTLYRKDHPVNDISAGSCVVMPAAFDEITLADHRPALFIAAPVLKKTPRYSLPFAEAFYGLVEWWDPNCAVAFHVYGGGWTELIVAPDGVQINKMESGPANENLLPNQSMLNGSKKLRLGVGDFIFYRPKQGDAIMQFETIVVVRGGKIVARWKPFDRRL